MASNQCWTRPWAPMVEGVTTRMSWTRTLELEELRIKDLYVKDFTNNYPISSGYILYADGDGGTYWSSDGVLSTLLNFGNTYLSSIPDPLHVAELYTNGATSTSNIFANSILLLSTPTSGTTLFTNGTISANTVVVYGSNTLYNQGILSLYDIVQKNQQGISLSNQQIYAGATTTPYYVTSNFLMQNVANLGQRYVSSQSVVSSISSIVSGLDAGVLVSTVTGIGTARYMSTSALVSTVGSLLVNGGELKISNINSTISGLGTARYVSSLSLQSTVAHLLANPPEVILSSLVSSIDNLSPFYVSSTQLASTITSFFDYAVLPNLTSTIGGLGSAGYVSTLSLFSTTQGLTTFFINTSQLTSSVQGLGSASYISTPTLLSTVNRLFVDLVANSNVQSTLQNLGSIDYISTPSLASTTASLQFNLFQNTSTVSTVAGLGSAFYVSTSGLTSTVTGVYGFSNVLFTSSVASSITGLGGLSYLSTLSLQSTVKSLLSQDVVLVNDFFSSVIGLSNVYPQALLSTTDGFVQALVTIPWTRSTVQGLGATSFVSSLSLQSTVRTLQSIYITRTGLQSTVQGLGTASYVSSSSLVSTVAGFSAKQTLLRPEIVSTVEGLGSVPYVSTPALQSTVTVFLRDLPINSGVTSSLQTLSAQGFVSSLSMQSTMTSIIAGYQTNTQVASTTRGLGSLGYVSTLSLASTTGNLYTNFMTVTGLQSTTLGLSNVLVNLSNLQSTNVVIVAGNVPTDIYSTVTSLGQADYISTPALVSTFSNLYFNSGALFGISLFSTIPGLGTARYVSTAMLQSSVAGALALGGNAINILNLTSTVTGLCNAYLKQITASMDSISSGLGNFSTVGVGISSSNSDFSLNVASSANIAMTTLDTSQFGVLCMSCGFCNNNNTTVPPYSNVLPPNPGGVAAYGYPTYKIMYSTDGGANWNAPVTFQGTATSNFWYDQLSAMKYNGKFFFCAGVNNNDNAGSPTNGRLLMLYYSSNGSNWFTYSNSNYLCNTDAGEYYHTEVTPRYSYIMGHLGAYRANATTCNQQYLSWLFEHNNPTVIRGLSTTQVTWSYVDLSIPLSNYRRSGIAYNGLFYCIGLGGTTSATHGNDPYGVLTSYDGLNWTQLNVGFASNINAALTNIPVTIGNYIYLFSINEFNTFKRSIDGTNWETVTYSNFFSNYSFTNNVPFNYVTPTPYGFFMNGLTIGTAQDAKSFFFTNSRLKNANVSNIILMCNITRGNAVPTTFTTPYYLKQVGKDSTRYLLWSQYAVQNGTVSGNFFWISSNSMQSWTSILGGCNYYLNKVFGIASSYDYIPPSFTISNTGLSLYSFDSEPWYKYTRQTSNYIATRGLSNLSTIVDINNSLFVKNSERCVNIGAVRGMNPFLSNIFYTNSNIYDGGFFSSFVASPSTIAFEVDGAIRTMNATAYLPSQQNWTIYSDQRIKTDIQEADYQRCLDIVSSINLYHYRFISSYYSDFRISDSATLGFLADQVSSIFPNSTREFTYNSSTFLTLDADQMNMVTFGATKFLVSTLNERSQLIVSQENAISTLKSDIETLSRYFNAI